MTHAVAGTESRRKTTTYIFILLMLFAGMFLISDTLPACFIWDSHDLFELFENYELNPKTGPELFSLSGHVSYAFTFVGYLIVRLCGTAVRAQKLYGQLLMLAGMSGFLKLLRRVHSKNLPAWLAVLLTAVYGVSPYLLGLSFCAYPDYALWCVIPLLTYGLYAGNLPLTFITALCFVFTKETAVITYVPLVAALYFYECIEKKKLFHDIPKYVILALPCILWLIVYLFISHWEGYGYFGFDPAYIWDKTKTFLFMNFNWVFAAAAVTGCIAAVRRNRKSLRYIVPTAISAAVYYVFSVLYVTVNQPRYVDAFISQLYFLASFFVVYALRRNILKAAVSGTAGILLFVSSFRTVDPLMLLLFQRVDTGNAVMVTTSQVLSDGMAYNTQYTGFVKAVDLALEGVCTDPAAEIFFPAGIERNVWFFDGMGYYLRMEPGEVFIKNEAWDDVRRTRMCNEADPAFPRFEINFITDDYPVETEREGYYFYTDCYGSEKADEILEKAEVIWEDEIEGGGWVVKRIRFRGR